MLQSLRKTTMVPHLDSSFSYVNPYILASHTQAHSKCEIREAVARPHWFLVWNHHINMKIHTFWQPILRHTLSLNFAKPPHDDSCFSFSVAYNRTDERYSGDTTDTSVMFRIGLRTIGDYDYKYSLDDVQ